MTFQNTGYFLSNSLENTSSFISLYPSHYFIHQLVPIYSKRHLQHDSIPFFPLAQRFKTFLLGHAHTSKFGVFGQESEQRL